MKEEKYPGEWIVVDHIIPGVTAEMLDWWWVNMEKGYELWCPDEHKAFRWEIKPPPGEAQKISMSSTLYRLHDHLYSRTANTRFIEGFKRIPVNKRREK
jgi:hypothetical protein